MVVANAGHSAREQLTLIRLFEALRALAYEDGDDTVGRYVRRWSRMHASQSAGVLVPLSFAPGEAYQFDCRHEVAVMNGADTMAVKVARLRHIRLMFVRIFPRESQEMVFDAHEPAVASFPWRLYGRHLRQHEVCG